MQAIDTVAAFGKIFFIPINESVPVLPEMSLLIFKEEKESEIYPCRAACIDLEMDACGTSTIDAAKNLKKALFMYIGMEYKAAEGSIIEAAKAITIAAFSKSRQKKEDFDLYRKAKERYILQTIEARQKIAAAIEAERQKEMLMINNDAIWKKIISMPHQPKVPGTILKNKALNPTAGKNWLLIYRPSGPNRIHEQFWENKTTGIFDTRSAQITNRQVSNNGRILHP